MQASRFTSFLYNGDYLQSHVTRFNPVQVAIDLGSPLHAVLPFTRRQTPTEMRFLSHNLPPSSPLLRPDALRHGIGCCKQKVRMFFSPPFGSRLLRTRVVLAYVVHILANIRILQTLTGRRTRMNGVLSYTSLRYLWR